VADTTNNRVLFWRNLRAANGSRADGVIGQNDFFATGSGGPGTSNSVGLRSPSGLAVDARGNVYVVDTGNNRILRFPRSALATDTGDPIQPNLVIGQTSYNNNQANLGEPNPSARSLAFVVSNTAYTAGIAFDSAGNLWATDSGNDRVLRYPASVLGDSATNAPSADLVIGQSDFSSRQRTDWGRPETRLLKTVLRNPTALTFDPTGRLIVTDSAGRMLVYGTSLTNGASALRIAGIQVNIEGQPPRPAVSEFTLFAPEGVFATATGIFVTDVATHRIVRYDPIDQWPAETATQPSPSARAVFGQPDLLSFRVNSGRNDPGEATFAGPNAMVLANNEVYLSDSSNNRVLVMPLNGVQIAPATRVLGQVAFNYRAINLVEGRELFLASAAVNLPQNGGSVILSGSMVIDRNSNPPRLYISDPFNHRVLGFADARRVKPGDTADLVIGQASLFESKANSPANDPELQTDTGLVNPAAVAVDAAGNLYVADSGNGRVLRFAKPFDQPQKAGQRANLVLGQTGFNIRITDATQRNLSRPYGLALTVDGHLLVSDLAHSRVLFFRRPPGGDFTNGQNASAVFGQRDFTSSGAGNEESRFNSPTNIATDTDDRLYVCDTGNRRLAIFDRVLSASSNPSPALTLTTVSGGERLSNIQGVSVSPRTGEIWVADTPNNRTVRYSKFDDLVFNPNANYTISAISPLAVAIDGFDNLLIADATNRVAFHYPGLTALSAGHYLRRAISPGMIAAFYPLGIQFGDTTASFSSVPLPAELGDVEVQVNDQPARLFFVSPGQINLLVPMSLPVGSPATFIVQRKSTGQILASNNLDIAAATPSFFTTTQNGQGQIAALNEDNSVNTNTNGIDRGKVVQLYATGQGFIPNAPPDGTPAEGQVRTPDLPRVAIGSAFLAESDILYSGLAPGLVGVWQLNLRVPMTVPPGSATEVVILHKGIPSNQQPGSSGVIRTTIAVK
jgi:uncharacterized protein (TIGR03437 family)